MNQFVDFYKKHNISPVRQNISDFQNHFLRRKSLYRELGLIDSGFANANILEIGPGSGYNSIITALYDFKSYVLVEPNTRGYNDMLKLFEEQKIDVKNIRFINDYAENIEFDEKFDIVLCEGLLPGLDNKTNLLKTLSEQVKAGGVLAITTVDEVSIFLDIVRRFIGNLLIHDVDSFERKVEILSKAFQSHLEQLSGSSRPIEDWVADVLINPASSKPKDYFSIEDAINYFNEEFYYYNSSPNIFTNIHWYKNEEQEPKKYNHNYLTQFFEKRHVLLLQKMDVSTREPEKNRELLKQCSKFININLELEKGADMYQCIEDAISSLEAIKLNFNDDALALVFNEIIEILRKPSIERVSESKHFASSFGKGQQYISFIKAD